jgi:hypothetical protein
MSQKLNNPYQSSVAADGHQDKLNAGALRNFPSALTVAALVLGAAATRLAPHWWNLTAIGAVCLFGGAYFQRRWLAFFVPLAALAVSDVLLQTFIYPQYGPNYFKYVCFALTVPLGMLLRGRTTLLPVGGAAVGATVLFFLLSNFEVWLSGHGNRYALTPAGLLACYIAALPFSLNMLYGNVLFSGLLFGAMETYKSRQRVLLPAPGKAVAA